MDADVIVVGAGPVGLFLAAELALAGAEPLVLERLAAPSGEPKARGLGPLATELLWRRGLGDRLAEADADGRADLARDHGSTLGHFAGIHKLAGDPQRPRTLIWQPRLERLLAEHADGAGVRMRRGHAVATVESDADGVTVDGRWRARFLVGCDGGRSVVRTAAGFAFPGTDALLRTTAARVRLSGDVPAAGRYPSGEFLRGGSMAGVTEPATVPAPSGPVTPAELAAAIRRVTGHDVTVHDLTDGRRFTDQARQAATYRRGRVFLAGDAAHVHSPSGGQGLNLGLLDAGNLGWKLAAAVHSGGCDGLLDTYTRERHPAGAAVLRNTMAQSALLAPGPHVDALREVMSGLMDLPEAGGFLADLLAGVRLRYDLGAPDPVGRLVADRALTHDDGRVTRLHEHTRTGRGLFVLPPSWRHLADRRVDVVAVTDPSGPLLLRPDGVVAWAGEGSPDVALRTWFPRECEEVLTPLYER